MLARGRQLVCSAVVIAGGVGVAACVGEEEQGEVLLQTKFGIPDSTTSVRHHRLFSSEVDSRLRIPKWSLEYMSEETVRHPAVRSRSGLRFYEDDSCAEFARAPLDAYVGSGYDRGHMVPVADLKQDAQAMAESFELTNVAPQTHGSNAQYWARMERYGRHLTKQFEEVFVVSGPLLLPLQTRDGRWETRHEWIGSDPEHLVAVPTHFFKVYLGVGLKKNGEGRDLGEEGDVGIGAFVVPNRTVHDDVPLETFAVSLRSLEHFSGVQLFPQAPIAEKDVQVVDERAVLHRFAKGKQWPTIEAGRLIESPSSRVHVPTGAHFLPSALFSRQLQENKKKQDEIRQVLLHHSRKLKAANFGPNRHLFHLCDTVSCTLPPPWSPDMIKTKEPKKLPPTNDTS